MKYYELHISETSKPIGSKDNYSMFNKETKYFDSIKDIQAYLKETYGGHKKEKMYIDDKNGKPKQSGWIYCYRNKDWSHNSESWLQQDWIEIREIHAETIII